MLEAARSRSGRQTWRAMFNGPNAFTLTDVRYGGSVTFHRVG
jgi:hypothetical protein